MGVRDELILGVVFSSLSTWPGHGWRDVRTSAKTSLPSVRHQHRPEAKELKALDIHALNSDSSSLCTLVFCYCQRKEDSSELEMKEKVPTHTIFEKTMSMSIPRIVWELLEGSSNSLRIMIIMKIPFPPRLRWHQKHIMYVI